MLLLAFSKPSRSCTSSMKRRLWAPSSAQKPLHVHIAIYPSHHPLPSVSKLVFRVSKPRRCARRCVEERIPVAPCRQRFELLGKLNARIAELNDGPFVADDQETPRVEAL